MAGPRHALALLRPFVRPCCVGPSGTAWGWSPAGAASAAAACMVLGTALAPGCAATEAQDARAQAAARARRDLPTYTAADVAAHNAPEHGVWVSYQQGVYDISSFAKQHPGGPSKIMLAAGGALEPFWALYAGPHAKPETLKQLERLRIGNLRQDAAARAAANVDDPYAADPPRHPALVRHSTKPFNAETPPAVLADVLVTPASLFYVRHHMPVPEVDEGDYELEIRDGRGGSAAPTTLKLSLDELRTKFPKAEVEATLQCTGNRRSSANEHAPTKGINWDVGAISNAVWGGARLRDVLAAAGYDVDALARAEGGVETHIRFEGLDADASGEPYGSSVPASRLLQDDSVLLAYEMNGEPLPRDHGAPVRMVVPGVTGARSVKWLGAIEVSTDESLSFWQRDDYKIYPPGTTQETKKDMEQHAIPIQDTPVQSAITSAHVVDGAVACQGYAFSGGGRGILRVDLSVDGGATWTQAELRRPEPHASGRTYAWTLWSAKVPLPAGRTAETARVMVRAIDDEYNMQPASTAHCWNFRGLLTNSWHAVEVRI